MMLANTPRVSVCIPTFRRPGLLSEAVQSVLANRYAGTEIVVSDDDRDPAVAQMLAAMHRDVRYIEGPACGIAENWTHVVRQARAPYVMKLDDDDLLRPDFLQQTCGLLDRHPEVSIAFAAHTSRGMDGDEHAVIDDAFFQGRDVVSGAEYVQAILLNRAHPRNHKSAGIFRAAVAAKVGFFMQATVDVMFTLAMAAYGNVGYVREPLFVYCEHPGQNEGMGWRPLQMTLESLPRVLSLPGFLEQTGLSGMREDILARMFYVVPLMYIGNHCTRKGLRAGWSTARRVRKEFPRHAPAFTYWGSVLALSLLPQPLYDRLMGAYSRSDVLKRTLNRWLGCGRKPPQVPCGVLSGTANGDRG